MLRSNHNIFAKESAARSDNPAFTTMKMKGLFKGLRYISQIFEEEEEQELQIGNPTDVKHVAHIGWNGPTANAPSWIDKFKGEGDATYDKAGGGDLNKGSKAREPTVDSSSKRKSEKSKGSRRKGSTESSVVGSPRKSMSETKTKQFLPLENDLEPPSARREKSSRRKKSKASSRPSKSKHTSQSAEG